MVVKHCCYGLCLFEKIYLEKCHQVVSSLFPKTWENGGWHDPVGKQSAKTNTEKVKRWLHECGRKYLKNISECSFNESFSWTPVHVKI